MKNTKNAVFWNVAQCRYCVNRRFGGTESLHLEGRDKDATCSPWFLARGLLLNTLKTEAIRSSETSVYTISTRRHIPEGSILHSHRRENLKSYTMKNTFGRIQLKKVKRSLRLINHHVVKAYEGVEV
jgi:hypothetical protein